MSDDWNGFIGVLILLSFMIIYCKYLQIIAISEKEWINLKCNPLFMIFQSIGDEEASLKNFKSCVKQLNQSPDR